MPIKPVLANFNLTGMLNIINKANKRFANNEARSFRRTVANWENKPKFMVVSQNVGLGIMDYKVFTTSKIYHWINDGTDPHLIVPVRAKSLRFQEGYVPKTKTDKIVSSGSGERVGDTIFSQGVTQSIKPRDFTGQIRKKAPDRWSKALNTELNIFIKGSVK